MSLPDATAELASLVARAAHDRGGINPVLVDVTSKLALADAFVVVSAPTDRQVRAIAEDIMDRIWAEHHRRPAHIEGRAEGTWVLLDYSELLVHVLSDEERDYYALERLWGDCPAVSIDVDTEEARAAAEALQAARADCAGLREAGAEREQALEALRRDNDGLRASEAAARERADELQARLAAAKERPLVEKWKREDAQGKLGAAAFLDSGRLGPGPGRKDRMFASLSNLAELKSAAAAAAALDDYGYEFDHLDLGQYGDATERKVNKRRSILRKFGDLFRRSRSLYKHY